MLPAATSHSPVLCQHQSWMKEIVYSPRIDFFFLWQKAREVHTESNLQGLIDLKREGREKKVLGAVYLVKYVFPCWWGMYMSFPPIQSKLCSSLKLLCCQDGHFMREQSILWVGARKSEVAMCSWPETFSCCRLLGQMVWLIARFLQQCRDLNDSKWFANDLIRSLVCHWWIPPCADLNHMRIHHFPW